MSDTKKFNILIKVMTAIIVLILSYNIFQEYIMTGVGDYVKRRMYYERVISKKGLSLHKGMYWKEKE
jgi:hypothetical protein